MQYLPFRYVPAESLEAYVNCDTAMSDAMIGLYVLGLLQ